MEAVVNTSALEPTVFFWELGVGFSVLAQLVWWLAIAGKESSKHGRTENLGS
jgi:hypothetical protein